MENQKNSENMKRAHGRKLIKLSYILKGWIPSTILHVTKQTIRLGNEDRIPSTILQGYRWPDRQAIGLRIIGSRSVRER
jgi:hypothetical protein